MDRHPESTPVPSNPLRWFPEFLSIGSRRIRPQARVLGLSLVVGVIAGVGAVAFYVSSIGVFHYTLGESAGYHPHRPLGERELFTASDTPLSLWLLVLVPAIGGLVSGVLVYSLAPEAEGHGTDAVITAYHLKQGVIRLRVPIVKIIASAITLGTGGSGGREGPIAQIGAGFGSFLGGLLRLRPAERRVLMAAGMGAGIAAIFRAPLAGALFAAEVLYFSPDFESEVILPAGLASVAAYCTFGLFFSDAWNPLFRLPDEAMKSLVFNDPVHLVGYTVLTVGVVVLAMLYTRTFYLTTYLFRRIPIPPHVKPMIGGFLTAVAGVALYLLFGRQLEVLSVLSFGYGILQQALQLTPTAENNIGVALVLLAIAFGKILTTSLTIGSGGSGGVFGPSMVIGGCGGGAIGILLHAISDRLVPHPASFVIVGMAGFFAAAAKTPFSTLVMVSELTGNYNLILPALWVCALSFLLADEQSIYSAQVLSRSRSPAHQGDYVREVLAGVSLDRFLAAPQIVPTVAPSDPLDVVLDRLADTPYHILPVTEEGGKLVGVISLEEVHLATQLPHLRPLVKAVDLMRSDVVPLRPGDRLDLAVELFAEFDLLALPVVDDSPAPRVIGVVRRSDVFSTYVRLVHGGGRPPSGSDTSV